MATLTLRPTSATGTNWQNTAYVYDGNTNQAATVSINSSNYSQRTLTVNFSTSSIPQNAQITKATLTVIAKQSSSTSTRRITVQADINGSSSSRVISQQLTSTTNTTLTADIANYMGNLSSLTITGVTSGSSYQSQTFSIYEIYVDVEYQEANVGQQIEIYLPQSLGSTDKLYWNESAGRYFIQHSTGIIQTDITQKIEFITPSPFVKISTNDVEVAPSNITVELAMKEVIDDGGNEEVWVDATVKEGYYPDAYTFEFSEGIYTTDLIAIGNAIGVVYVCTGVDTYYNESGIQTYALDGQALSAEYVSGADGVIVTYNFEPDDVRFTIMIPHFNSVVNVSARYKLIYN